MKIPISFSVGLMMLIGIITIPSIADGISEDIKYAKTLQDLTIEDRNKYYGKEILSEEAIEYRLDICNQMQSEGILPEYTAETPPQKIDCKEYINTLYGVDVILDYIISKELN